MRAKVLLCCSEDRAETFRKILQKNYFQIDNKGINDIYLIEEALNTDDYQFVVFDARSLRTPEKINRENAMIQMLWTIVTKFKNVRILLVHVTDDPVTNPLIQRAIQYGIYDIITTKDIPVRKTNEQLQLAKSVDNINPYIDSKRLPTEFVLDRDMKVLKEETKDPSIKKKKKRMFGLFGKEAEEAEDVDAQEELERFQAIAAQAEEEILAMRDALQQTNQEKQKKDQELYELKKKTKELENQVSQIGDRSPQTAEELIILRTENQTKEQEITTLQSQLASMKAGLKSTDTIQKEYEKVRAERDALQQKEEQNAVKMQQADRTIVELQKKISEESNKEHDSSDDKLNELETLVRKMESDLSKLETERDLLKQDSDRKQNEIAQLMEQHTHALQAEGKANEEYAIEWQKRVMEKEKIIQETLREKRLAETRLFEEEQQRKSLEIELENERQKQAHLSDTAETKEALLRETRMKLHEAQNALEETQNRTVDRPAKEKKGAKKLPNTKGSKPIINKIPRKFVVGAASMVLVISLGGFSYNYFVNREPEKPTYAQLLKEEDFSTAASHYPEKKSEIENKLMAACVDGKKDALEELEAFNKKNPTTNGDFDVAFFSRDYEDASNIYLKNEKKFRRDSDRLSLAGYACLKVGNITEAEKIQEQTEDSSLLEMIMDYKILAQDLDKKQEELKKLQDDKKDFSRQQELSDEIKKVKDALAKM